MRRTRHTVLAATAVAVALTGCADDPAAGPTGADDATTATSPAEPTTPSTGTEAAPPIDGQTVPCVVDVPMAGVDRIQFAVPSDWQVGDDCAFFDPDVDALEPGTEAGTALSVQVSEASFADFADTSATIRDETRLVGARSGYQAVRIEGVSTGEGLYDEGTRRLLWLVDLDAGVDETGGTLVASARAFGDTDYATAAATLDRIAETLLVRPTAVDESLVVTRTEGGGDPYTVTRDADGCFRLHAGGPDDEVVAEDCDVDPTSAAIATTVLGDADLRVVAGYAPPTAVSVTATAATAPYGAVTSGVEGASTFAFRPLDGPVELSARNGAGSELATTTVAG